MVAWWCAVWRGVGVKRRGVHPSPTSFAVTTTLPPRTVCATSVVSRASLAIFPPSNMYRTKTWPVKSGEIGLPDSSPACSLLATLRPLATHGTKPAALEREATRSHTKLRAKEVRAIAIPSLDPGALESKEINNRRK